MTAKKRVSTGDGQFSISFKTLGAIGTLLAIILALYSQLGKIATKDDVEKLASTYSSTYKDIETRVRTLEIQMAEFFGKNANLASPIKPSETEQVVHHAIFLRTSTQDNSAPMSQQAVRGYSPARRIVVTFEFIKTHDLVPSRGGSYAVYGEDGNFYALDDILAILIKEHQEDVHPSYQMKRK